MIEEALRYAGGEGEQGDGEAMATGDLHGVGVSGLFLFTAIMWKVSKLAIIVKQYVPDW